MTLDDIFKSIKSYQMQREQNIAAVCQRPFVESGPGGLLYVSANLALKRYGLKLKDVMEGKP